MSLALSAGQRAPHRVALQGCQNSLGSSPAVCADGFGKGDGENANVCSPCGDNEITHPDTNKCTACTASNTEPNVAQNACGELPQGHVGTIRRFPIACCQRACCQPNGLTASHYAVCTTGYTTSTGSACDSESNRCAGSCSAW